MSFFDTLESKASSWLTNLTPADVQSGLQSVGIIKVAKPPTSNLTAAQVQSGQTGSIQNFGGDSASAMPAWLIPVAVGIAVIGVIFAVVKGKK